MKKHRTLLLLLGLILLSLHALADEGTKDQRSGRTKAVVKQLKANLDRFGLTLRFHGEIKNPFYTLRVTTSTIRTMMMMPPDYLDVAGIKDSDAIQIIDHLADSGYFDRAGDISKKKVAHPKGPAYTLSVHGRGRHYYAVLGWDLDTYRTIDALGVVLDGKAAKAMAKVRARLEEPRKQWIKQAAGKPSTTVVNGLAVTVKPQKSVFRTDALAFTVTYQNKSAKTIQLFDPDFWYYWDIEFRNLISAEVWAHMKTKKIRRSVGPPISLKPGEKHTLNVDLRHSVFVRRDVTKRRLTSPAKLPPGQYELVLTFTLKKGWRSNTKNAKTEYWTGEIATKPVVFERLNRPN